MANISGWLRALGGHLETIIPSVFRRVNVQYTRTRFELADGDFVDLDRISNGNDKLLVLLHGLEGSSQSTYIKGFAKYFSARKFNICVLNFRGCSGEHNRLLQSYHSGATADLHEVLVYFLHEEQCKQIYLCGFSLGGNVLLKYLGDGIYPPDPAIKAAAAFSVPIDLAGSAAKLAQPANRIYMRRFLKTMNEKIAYKVKKLNAPLNIDDLHRIKTFAEWDTRFTAPVHGFRDATDYYATCSCKPFLDNIPIPTLLVNAKNDPFLSAACYLTGHRKAASKLVFEAPAHGGHVGFRKGIFKAEYDAEERAWNFFCNIHKQSTGVEPSNCIISDK